MNWLLLLAVLLALAGCGAHTSPVGRPCTPPVPGGPADVDCEWESCHNGDPGCVCYDAPGGQRCQKITTCPVPVPPDARVSR